MGLIPGGPLHQGKRPDRDRPVPRRLLRREGLEGRQPARDRGGARARRAGADPRGGRHAARDRRIFASAETRFRIASPQILPEARKAGVPLAIEPLHPMQVTRAAVNTLEQALDMCDALGEGVGVGGRRLPRVVGSRSSSRRCKRAGQAHPRLSHLRLAAADARPVQRPRHDGRRRDRFAARSAPGSKARAIRGFQEVEIFSELDWWKRDPDEVLRTCKERVKQC